MFPRSKKKHLRRRDFFEEVGREGGGGKKLLGVAATKRAKGESEGAERCLEVSEPDDLCPLLLIVLVWHRQNGKDITGLNGPSAASSGDDVFRPLGAGSK